jgi:hypothetical protein
MYFDGDKDDEWVGDTTNQISISTGRTLTAKTRMTLESSTGYIVPIGTLTLAAEAGIVLHDSLSALSGHLRMNSNSDFADDGIFTISATKTLDSANSVLTLTVSDIDLEGKITTGTAPIVLLPSIANATFGLGATSPRNITVSGTELARITSNGLEMGSNQSSTIEVSGITQSNSNAVDGVISLIATRQGAQIVFDAMGSSFNALVAQANNGITLSANVATDTGVLTLDGDSNDGVDGDDRITFNGARTLISETVMTLDATSGGLFRADAQILTLKSNRGVTINDHLTIPGHEGVGLHIDADSNGSGSGTFTLASGKTLSTNKGLLLLTAADVQVLGSVTTGNQTITLHTAAKRTIGLGTTSQDMDIVGAELGMLTAQGLTIGKPLATQSITVQGITVANSGLISGILTLITTVDDSQIVFDSGPSLFYALSAQADNGVMVNTNVTTTSDAMYLDGDFEDEGDAMNTVKFGHGSTTSAKTLLTLEASIGSIQAGGDMTLTATTGIVIHDHVSGMVAGS